MLGSAIKIQRIHKEIRKRILRRYAQVLAYRRFQRNMASIICSAAA
ncbi:hypothetical protein SAMN05216316_1375 [Nitrosovibrio sp. Nv6]|nr:hypothetical protein SAMN05216316_1375 [Nitrosovibrio sp. Nv6]